MIPLKASRALFVLFAVSAVIAVVEYLSAFLALPHALALLVKGLVAGGLIFVVIWQGGRFLLFCSKNTVHDPVRRDKVAAALRSIGVLVERRTARGHASPQGHVERRVSEPTTEPKMYVSIVESPRFIAITVRSGKTHRAFVSSQIVDSLSPAALRGVLAHEYGHVLCGHPSKQAYILALVATVKLSIGVPAGAVVAILLAYLFMLREWEYVADAKALERTGKLDLLAAFSEYQAVACERNLSRLSEFFCGHPSLHRRVAAVANTDKPTVGE